MPFAFLRQCVLADERPLGWPRKLWKPQGAGALAARDMAIITTVPLALGIINVLRGSSLISTTILNISLSFGILGSLWLFTNVYVNSQPVFTSFLAKLSGTTLTIVLFILASIGWVVAPTHIAEYRPRLSAAQSLRFTPNALGGYDSQEIPYYFENEIGEELPVTSRGDGRNQRVDFSFRFYGKTYSQVYITSVGLIRMGEPLYHPNLQYRDGHFPGIFALLIDLEPDSEGGVYARVEADRLIVTWKDLPALHQPESLYTFQAVLYRDGRFDLNYKSLPDTIFFDPDTTPSSNIWLRGVTPGTFDPVPRTDDLPAANQIGPDGLLQDFNADFRTYLDGITRPLAWLVIIASLFLFGTIPLLLNASIVKPLNTLLGGVKQMDEGNLDISIPAQNMDEIGILTRAFDDLTTWIHTLVTGLEERIAERTAALRSANDQLQHEMILREASQAQLLEQQRALAILGERERVSREIHDGLAQLMNTISVQVQTAQIQVDNRQVEPAKASLEHAAQLARQATSEIRGYILDLRTPVEPQSGFFEFIENHLSEYHEQTGIQARLSLPSAYSFPAMTPAAEEQVLHILQEALANTRKHSKANWVEITFSADERSLQITIQDDGIGFDPGQQIKDENPHFGLKIMQERIQILGGRLEIRSAPGKGTKILAFLPRMTSDAVFRQVDEKKVEELRILLVDDSPIFLEGLRNLLTARGLTVVGLAHDGLEAQEQARQLQPDLVVMDVLMPRCNGIEATRAIKAEFPEIKIVMLTTSEKEEHLFEAIKLGASGFLLKGIDANDFCAALEKMGRGETILSPDIASRIITELSLGKSQSPRSLPADAELSERQRQILDLVAGGMTYKEVGNQLHLSEKTIKYHMAQILEHLHLKSRSQAIAFARGTAQRPIEPPEPV